MPDDFERNQDLDLWTRFIARCIEQTKAGTLKWAVRYAGEYEPYSVTRVLDRDLRLDPKKGLAVVDAEGGRIYVASCVMLSNLHKAVLEKLDPEATIRSRQFLRKFLGEPTEAERNP